MTSRLVHRNRRTVHTSRDAERPSFTASEVKNGFGAVLEKAIRGETILITKHDAPRAVLMSVERYEELQKASAGKLDILTAEFDGLLDRMQTADARAGLDAAYRATPIEMGIAATRAARKRA